LSEGTHLPDCHEKPNIDVLRQDEASRSSEESRFRLFLSFNPPPDVVGHLSQAQKTLRRLLDCAYGPELPIRWTRSVQFHLTVLFFGNTSAAKTNTIRARLIELVGDRPEFPCLTAKGFGCFPTLNRPRVLWIGFAGSPSLRNWQDRLAKAFQGDFMWKERDRSYPHVTIARLAFQRLPARFGEHLFELAQQTGMPSWGWQIDSISLMRSIPGPKGPEYVALTTLPRSL
jgi:RNA 2',3'-cyclic 3'-phosphodiesterase